MRKAYLLLCILMIKMRQIDQCFPHDLILSTKEQSISHISWKVTKYRAYELQGGRLLGNPVTNLILNKNIIVFHCLTYDIAIFVFNDQYFLRLCHPANHQHP